MVALDWDRVLRTDLQSLPDNLDEADDLYDLVDAVIEHFCLFCFTRKILLMDYCFYINYFCIAYLEFFNLSLEYHAK